MVTTRSRGASDHIRESTASEVPKIRLPIRVRELAPFNGVLVADFCDPIDGTNRTGFIKLCRGFYSLVASKQNLFMGPILPDRSDRGNHVRDIRCESGEELR